ncbi:putative superoxide dismutase [Arabidopsis thaliana]
MGNCKHKVGIPIARAVQREQEGTETEDEENPDDQEPEVYLDSDIDVSEVD